MMLIEEVKLKQVTARKNRDSFRAGVLTTLLGEAEKIGKDAGNRLTTDDECIRIIKKFIKNINETLKVTDKNSEALNAELKILSEFLPDEISDADLTIEIITIIDKFKLENPHNPVVIGPIMKILKQTVSNYNGKTASDIIRKTILKLNDN